MKPDFTDGKRSIFFIREIWFHPWLILIRAIGGPGRSQGCIKPAWERWHPAGEVCFDVPAGRQRSQAVPECLKIGGVRLSSALRCSS
jgi:hypothetical protein